MVGQSAGGRAILRLGGHEEGAVTMTRSMDGGHTGDEAIAAIARRFNEPFNTGNVALYDDLLAADWVDHPLAPGQHRGRAGLAPIVATFRAAFPDLTVENEAVLVAGDTVTVRSLARGTQSGAFLGHPPTGKRVEFMAIEIHRIAGGRIVETWHVEDWRSLMAQLGLPLPPGA
jgi:steroid delta-isomerase-like uncharacterized protein